MADKTSGQTAIAEAQGALGGMLVELLLRQYGEQLGELILSWLLKRQGVRNEFLGLDARSALQVLVRLLEENREEILDLCRRQLSSCFDAGLDLLRSQTSTVSGQPQM